MKVFNKSYVIIRFNSMDMLETKSALNKAYKLLEKKYRLIEVSGWGGDQGESRDWKFEGNFNDIEE